MNDSNATSVRARGDSEKEVQLALRPAPGEAIETVAVARVAPRPSPVGRLVACSQPLHGFAALEARWPNLFNMWVRYHLRLGVDVLRVYDFDGSFAEASAPWVAGGRVIYEPWRDRLDPEVVAACAERGAAKE